MFVCTICGKTQNTISFPTFNLTSDCNMGYTCEACKKKATYVNLQEEKNNYSGTTKTG